MGVKLTLIVEVRINIFMLYSRKMNYKIIF